MQRETITEIETAPGADPTSNIPADEVVERSRRAAADLVSTARSLGGPGFVRLNAILRVALEERRRDLEGRVVCDERFGRPEAAEAGRKMLVYYATIFRMTELFIAATSDEAGLDALGVAFGGPSAGMISIPAVLIANLDEARRDNDPAAIGAALGAIKTAASDADLRPLWAAPADLRLFAETIAAHSKWCGHVAGSPGDGRIAQARRKIAEIFPDIDLTGDE
jgi:hypothetical protein